MLLQRRLGKHEEKDFVSTAFLDTAPRRQPAQVELWGILPEDDGDKELERLRASAASERVTLEKDKKAPHEAAPHEGKILESVSGFQVLSVAVGGGHAIFLTEGGVFAFGRNSRGQLGLGDDVHRDKAELILTTMPPSGTGAPPALRGAIIIPDTSMAEWAFTAVACGSDHSLLLGVPRAGGESCLCVCGAAEALGLAAHDDMWKPSFIPVLAGAVAIAARGTASCCAAPPQDAAHRIAPRKPVGTPSQPAGGVQLQAPTRKPFGYQADQPHLIYLWGEVPYCANSFLSVPTPVFRLRSTAKAVSLGGFFGLALDAQGEVFAWGDGSYGELGGAEDMGIHAGGGLLGHLEETAEELPEPEQINLPTLPFVQEEVNAVASMEFGGLNSQPEAAVLGHPQLQRQRSLGAASLGARAATPSTMQQPDFTPAVTPTSPSAPRRVVDIACGEHHSLLLDESGRVYAFGDNISGQCGVPEENGTGRIAGSIVPRPRWVPMESLRHRARKNNTQPQDPVERVFAGSRHSAVVTRERRVYFWGHPGNLKLGYVGVNQDGTKAGDDPALPRPPGVAVRSSLRDAIRRPRLAYSMLHKRVATMALGDECSIIVTGEWYDQQPSAEASASNLYSSVESSPMPTPLTTPMPFSDEILTAV